MPVNVRALVDHASDRVGTVLEFVKKNGDVRVVNGLFAFVGLKIAFGFVCLDFSIVHQYLVPRPIAIGGGCGNTPSEVVGAFISRVCIHDDAAVSKPLMVDDLPDAKHRCSSFEVTHDGPQAVSPARSFPGHFSIAYGA